MGCCQSSSEKLNTISHAKEIEQHEKLLYKNPLSDFDERYEFVDNIGKGAFGTVRKAKRKDTGKVYAVKVVHWEKGSDDLDWVSVQKEVAMLRKMDHPNIVTLHEVYSQKRTMYLVEQFCNGGELSSRAPYSENQAAVLFKDILLGLKYLHDRKIMHRDLKVENVMFESNAKTAKAVLIDFGASREFSKTKLYKRMGTPYTCAPEVILPGGYTERCDYWSAGVVLYLLLCNMKTPFYETNDQSLFAHIKSGKYDKENEAYQKLGDGAKDIIDKFLQLDPKKRLDINGALKHPWLKKHVKWHTHDNRKHASRVNRVSLLHNLSEYQNANELKKQAMIIAASRLAPKEIDGLRDFFISMDKDNSGVLTLNEFKDGLESLVPTEDLEVLFNAVDASKTGVISYTEFIAAAIETNQKLLKNELAEAFDRLDRNNTGEISLKDFESIMNVEKFSHREIVRILQDADVGNEGKITWDNFVQLLNPMDENK